MSVGLRQEAFVARHAPEWEAMEHWLAARGEVPRAGRLKDAQWSGMADDEFPARYRRLCQQLAIARRRGYSAGVVDRLQRLTHRGHAILYRPATPQWQRVVRFVMADFPRLVRAQRGCLWAAVALFALPLVAMMVATQLSPDAVYAVMTPHEVAGLESMYDPEADHVDLGRPEGDDFVMFGVYIFNNIGIGLRTFGAGLAAGIGSMVVLFQNGLGIGAAAGHLTSIGYGETFWSFVAGHSAPELIALVISGAAGMQLGFALLAPGRRSRLQALIEHGRIGAQLCLGVFLMLVLAAAIEAFWSAVPWISPLVKYGVGIAMWVLTLVWLWRGGRGGVDAD